MAYKVVILPTAAAERKAITDYLASFGASAVSSFLDEYEHQLELIASESINYGLSRFDELARLGYRMAPVNNYLFLYVIEDGVITVAHFFHQTQNYASLV